VSKLLAGEIDVEHDDPIPVIDTLASTTGVRYLGDHEIAAELVVDDKCRHSALAARRIMHNPTPEIDRITGLQSPEKNAGQVLADLAARQAAP
jgi:hypothetical protein